MAKRRATGANVVDRNSHKTNKLDRQKREELDVADESAAAAAAKTKNFMGNIPAELHIAIAEECDDEALLSLRRVCRQVTQDTSDVFAKRFFATTRHCLTAHSIKRLCTITGVARIARHIETLDIDIGSQHFEQMMVGKDQKQRAKTRATRRKYLKRLTEALRRLSALGAGSILVLHTFDCTIDLHCVGTALLQSNHAPRKLRVALEQVEDYLSVKLPTLSPEDLAGFSRVWMRLETLELNLLNADHSLVEQDSAMDFIRVLHSAAHLKSLSVTADGFPGVASLYRSLGATHLRELEMEEQELSTAELIQILEHYRHSLGKLKFAEIDLTEWDGWCAILQKIRDDMQLEQLSVQEVGYAESGSIHRFGSGRARAFSLSLQPPAMRERLTELLVVAPISDTHSESSDDDSLYSEVYPSLNEILAYNYNSDSDFEEYAHQLAEPDDNWSP
ncbi:hypothetical protein BST61_g1751 [Cercospora zeina]